MALLSDPILGFLFIFIASFLLAGEFLVNGRGVFGVIGFFMYFLFLYYHLSDDSPYWLIGVLVVGVLFTLIDGFLIANGSVAFIGLIFIMLSLAIPSPTLSYGLGVCVSFWLGIFVSLLLLKFFPARVFWKKLALLDRTSHEEGYSTLKPSTLDLVGKEGQTLSILRPVGTIEVEGERYSAITNGEWVEMGVAVVVTAVDGTKIVVKPLGNKKMAIIESGDLEI
jgi:membrane-bound ClpP family serine protease